MPRTAFFFVCGALLVVAALPGSVFAQPKAHVHGQATLDIGLEGRGGTLEFRAPADDLYGFEHAPKTAAERTKQSAAFALLRTKGTELVKFDATLGCTLTATAVGVLEEKGGHGDVRATYTLACQKATAGRPIAFGFSKAFPGVHSVKVQLLSETQQVGATITNDKGVVKP